jgi:hypothetical protein
MQKGENELGTIAYFVAFLLVLAGFFYMLILAFRGKKGPIILSLISLLGFVLLYLNQSASFLFLIIGVLASVYYGSQLAWNELKSLTRDLIRLD